MEPNFRGSRELTRRCIDALVVLKYEFMHTTSEADQDRYEAIEAVLERLQAIHNDFTQEVNKLDAEKPRR